MSTYIAVVHKDPDSDYGVSFPDFPGCITAGSTVDEAKDMAHEALSLHIKGMIEDGEIIPSPSSLEEITSTPETSDSVALLVVSVPDPKPKSIRVNITVPEDALKQIDAMAKKLGLSRSSFLLRAARDSMQAR